MLCPQTALDAPSARRTKTRSFARQTQFRARMYENTASNMSISDLQPKSQLAPWPPQDIASLPKQVGAVLDGRDFFMMLVEKTERFGSVIIFIFVVKKKATGYHP
eukprot:scaffold434_cov186-Pinguiococcus_pyrenoidosus.AAC.15